MADGDEIGVPLIIIGGGLALWWWWDKGRHELGALISQGGVPQLPAYAAPSKKRDPALAREVVNTFAPIFGVPASTMMVVGKIESDYTASATNANERAMKRGGAWGMFQQTLDTAKGHIVYLRNHTNPLVRQVAARFTGHGISLLDPHLNAALAAYQLGVYQRKYGGRGWQYVLAAYHSGPGTVEKAIKASKSLETVLGPNGRIYLVRAAVEHQKVAVA